jgi:chaperone required for assembly of F1-ATPase
VQFAREKCGARLILCEGVTFHPQAPEALAAIAARVRAHVGAGAAAPFRLAALHTMTTLTGSCIVALATSLREIDAETGFAAAHVDEDHQMRVWGADAEAMARRGRRLDEMRAAARLAALAG